MTSYLKLWPKGKRNDKYKGDQGRALGNTTKN